MELPCLPVETPTTASSSSTDPLYDNCPPFTQRGRDREKEMESRVVCPAVTGPRGPRSPPLALAPAVARVPTAAGGGRGAGGRPERSHCSWGGGGWERDPRTGAGGGGGERGAGWGSRYGEEGAGGRRSPSPDHRSTLSLYDNLPDPASPDSIPFDTETGFPECFEEHDGIPGAHIRGVLDDEESSEERSPWSSCEIILADQDHNPDPDPDRVHLQEPEPERDSASCDFAPGDLMRHVQRSQLQGGSPRMCEAGGEAAAAWPRTPDLQPPRGPRVPPPVPPADPSASALRSLLTSLQQQIVRQREEYEARIMSLEQRNEELQVEVVRLRTNLAQQRHWYQAVQAKIAQSERERAAAEQRNSTLQKDMEQFFDTFGELNSEAKKTEYIVKSF